MEEKEKKRLILTKHYTNSVIEVYLSEDETNVYQIKCLTHNRCKKYTFTVDSYIEKKMIGYSKVEDLINK
tara:strand:+ start:695 stop:904 length:210 start_codon:yes stop_codon:yes gene_type:complete